MNRFVIDEVILLNAHSGKDSRGNLDRTATRFVLNFCDSDHNLAINTKIKGKYYKQLANLNTQKFMLNVPSLIHQLLLDKKRVEYFEDDSFIFNGPKECDREFVRVSRESRGFLVTEDDPLITVIQEKKLTEVVQVKRVKDALHLVNAN